jgi:hemerythrin-like domain-containing protein
MRRLTDDPPAVVETRVIHDTHRRATSLLAEAIARDEAPHDAVTALRDLVVAMLRHHHESEDEDLWPLLTTAEPSLIDSLATLSGEHERLDGALDRLAADPSPVSAAEVRDLLHEHLGHEEPILFPALRAHVSDAAWAVFSERTVASAPSVGTHLLVGLFHEVATDGEVELILRHLPPDAMSLVPAMRAEATQTLGALRGAGR